MALRVLLADKSSTIKKVFQLALQDFAVEVKSVSLGVDVLPVAQKFQPDIVFADVLLQKQSGYEVSVELKKDDRLQTTPVVLMWSSFMELDQDKFDASGANAQLEKPFDVQDLRKLIQNLVPKTRNQDLSKFLKFPQMPEFITDLAKVPEAVSDPPQTAPDAENISGEMESFEQVNLSEAYKPTSTLSTQTKDEELLVDVPEDEESIWEQESLARFQVDIPEDEEAEEETPQVTYPNPEEQIDSVQMLPNQLSDDSALPPTEATETEPLCLEDGLAPSPQQALSTHHIDPGQVEKMVKAQIEELIHDKVANYLEEVTWKVVPELAEKIIERELKRLLEEFEPQQYR